MNDFEQENQEVAQHHEEQTSAPEVDHEIESEARESGWVPQDQYKGDPNKWVSAEEFVERGRSINPILRKNNERLRAELASDRAELKKLKLTIDEFKTEFATMKENAYKRAINDLKAQRREALKDGDFEGADAIDEQIDQYKADVQAVKPSVKQAPEPEPQQLSETFKEWQSENKWFNENKEPELFDSAEGYAIRLRNKIRKGEIDPLSEGEFLENVSNYIKKRYPEKFENPRRKEGSSVGGSGSRGETSGGKKSYSALPPEAKRACDDFVEQGIMTKEQYVAEYFGD